MGSIVILIILAAITGLATGLITLGRGGRSAGWWLMTLGIVLWVASPLLYLTAIWQMDDFAQNARAGGYISPTVNPLQVSGQFAFLCGLLVFAVGFILHGQDSTRSRLRDSGLEEALTDLNREISADGQGKEAGPPPARSSSDTEIATPPSHGLAVILLLALTGAAIAVLASRAGLRGVDALDPKWLPAWIIVLTAFAVGILTGLNELRDTHPNNPGAPKRRRGGSWWLMAIGMTCFVVPIGGIILMVITGEGGKLNLFGHLIGYLIAGLIAVLGPVLFAWGFALHGLKVARNRERIGELKQVRAAMEEEVVRLREAR